MAVKKEHVKDRPVIFRVTASEYKLLVMAAGGTRSLSDWLRTTTLLAAKEVKSEGV